MREPGRARAEFGSARAIVVVSKAIPVCGGVPASDDIPADDEDDGGRGDERIAASVTYLLAHNTRGIAVGSGGRGDDDDGDDGRVISTSEPRNVLLPTNAVHGRVLRCE